MNEAQRKEAVGRVSEAIRLQILLWDAHQEIEDIFKREIPDLNDVIVESAADDTPESRFEMATAIVNAMVG